MKRLYYNYVKWKNYQWSGVYHITLVTNHRGTNLFGSIVGDSPADAHVLYTELGRAIQTCILDIPTHHPQEKIVIEAATVMPDHIHFVLHVGRDLHTTTFGKIINGLKIGINQASRSFTQPNRSAVGNMQSLPNRSAVGNMHCGGLYPRIHPQGIPLISRFFSVLLQRDSTKSHAAIFILPCPVN